ncbi:MAG: Mth938-like domain-containing protein [Nitrosomonadales bacterium]|nr:Mth938-like domain-containing protein [Nitrosomonadales bacterium]
MKLNLVTNGVQKNITGHGAGYVAVNGERHQRAIVVTPEALCTEWAAGGFDELVESDFEYLLELKPEVVLLGTGERQRFVHPRLHRALTAAGIGIECMTTPAACRTFNVLAAEDRRVVAALLMR